MPEHEKQKATVAGLIAGAFGSIDELADFEAGEMLAPALGPPPVFPLFR